jgi:hypothetical protein
MQDQAAEQVILNISEYFIAMIILLIGSITR